MTYKNRKKSRIFMFLSTVCSLLRAEGFSCSLGVLYGGLGISKLQFLIKKIEIKFPFNFRPGSGSGLRIWNPDPQLEKMLDPDPYPDQCGSETLWAPVYSCTHWLRPRNSPSPHLGSHTRALLVSQDRRHLFVTPWVARRDKKQPLLITSLSLILTVCS
jgi:hypothetical protein